MADPTGSDVKTLPFEKAIEELESIVKRLEEGKVRIDAHCFADLKRIRQPLIVFASYGDNITPPHQALGWIPAVYGNTAALKAAVASAGRLASSIECDL
mgnify:CR=1 FL=1